MNLRNLDKVYALLFFSFFCPSKYRVGLESMFDQTKEKYKENISKPQEARGNL